MLRVGLTGGVASGKSTVAKMMELGGAYVIQADVIAHELTKPGQPIYEEVVKRFGESIVNPNHGGTIDRAKLATIAFGEGRIAELNRIVHPAVIQRQEEWLTEVGRKDPMAVAVVEAALIFEAGVHVRFDKLVVVTCAAEEKQRRFTERAALAGMDVHSAAQRFQNIIAAQLPEEDKVKAADYVIDNSGTLKEMEAKTEKVMDELRALAAAK